MMSFETNPYSWKEENITGTVGSVSLTRVNGTVIHVENLPEEIEVLFVLIDTFSYFILDDIARLQNNVFAGFFRFSYQGLTSGRGTARSWTLPISAH